MRQILFWLVFSSLTIISCSSTKVTKPDIAAIQGVEGHVYQVTGNRMPISDAPPVIPKGIQTTIYIYENTNIKDVARVGTSAFYQSIRTNLVKTIDTDSTGYFTAQLPVGTYSLFTKVNGLFYANQFDIDNNIFSVKVIKGEMTQVIFKMDAGAKY